MKRIYSFIVMLSIAVSLFAQATDLVIDNQTPGWLSSKINYGDQMTVRNLKVTGYINETDLKFIGTLTSNSLTGKIDLSDANVVKETSSGKDNYIKEGAFGKSDAKISYMILPKTLKELSNCFKNSLNVDTLFFDCDIKYAKADFFGNVPYNIILGANVDSIPEMAFNTGSRLKSVNFSPKTKYIGHSAFYYQSNLANININELQELEVLENNAFYGTSVKMDTLLLSSRLSTYAASAILFNDYAHVFIPSSIQSIKSYTWSGSSINATTHYRNFNTKKIYLHFKSPTPIPFDARSTDVTADMCLYVPKGAKAAYMKSDIWKNATIIELNPVTKIKYEENKITLDKEQTKQLSVSFTPTDADDTSVTWSVEDPTIASVDENGLVTALSPGKTKVIVTSVATGIQASCEITVIQHVTGASMNIPSLELTSIGETIQLTANVTPEDATDKSVKWSSTNTNVCSVTESGNVIAIGYGTAIVIATTTDGSFPATCVVNVIQPVTVKAQNMTKIYGDPNPTFEYSSEGAELVGTPVITCEATETTPVGEYPIVVTKGSVTNSNDSYINGTLTITKAPLKVSVGKYTRTKGEDNPEFTFSYEGFKNGDDKSVLLSNPTASTTATKESEVGEYPIYLSGGDAQNYELFYENGVLTIIASTGIEAVENSTSKVFNVYSIEGKKVRSNVTTLNNLTKGVYIVNRKKVVVK